MNPTPLPTILRTPAGTPISCSLCPVWLATTVIYSKPLCTRCAELLADLKRESAALANIRAEQMRTDPLTERVLAGGRP